MATAQGRFVWYELMTNDPAGAAPFYRALAGWATKAMPGNEYTMWLNGSIAVAGMVPLPEKLLALGVPPNWLSYVGVDDLVASLDIVRRLGGTISVPVTEMPGKGRFAVIVDPQGAVIALFQPARPDESFGAFDPAVGEMAWHELMTPDAPAAMRFYRELFGWEAGPEMDMGADGVYYLYGRGDTPYGGMMNRPKAMETVPPNWLPYIRVADVAGAAAAATAAGGKVLNGPMEVPEGGGWIAQLLDPQGAALAVFQLSVLTYK